VVAPDIPENTRQKVLRPYGIKSAKANQFEVDYLITPDLGERSRFGTFGRALFGPMECPGEGQAGAAIAQLSARGNWIWLRRSTISRWTGLGLKEVRRRGGIAVISQ